MILYATKIWRGEIAPVFERHPKANLIIGNNLDFKFVDIGQTDQPYYLPEKEVLNHTDGYEYVLWYAGDVLPPETDWVSDATPLLKTYPFVSPFWKGGGGDIDRTDPTSKQTDFGFITQGFSDQVYLTKPETLHQIDFECDHPIKERFPEHGGNSFERRVSQWLATTGQYRAVLTAHEYTHLTKEQK